jgi:acyl-coenzyme A thioesterase PaaI-like protein
MEKAQAKGEIAEDQLRALEMDVTGKVCHRCLLLRLETGYSFGSFLFALLDHACFMAWCTVGSHPGSSGGMLILRTCPFVVPVD